MTGDYPDCPECGTDLFVEGHTSQRWTYQCHNCETTFGEAQKA